MNGLERLCTRTRLRGPPGALAFAAGRGRLAPQPGPTSVRPPTARRPGNPCRKRDEDRSRGARAPPRRGRRARARRSCRALVRAARRSRSDSCSGTRADCRTTRRTRRSANATFATPTAVWHPEELLELAGTEAAGAGSFAYSNTNYVVVGLVVEAVGGAALGDQLARRVLEPLALQESQLAPEAAPQPAGWSRRQQTSPVCSAHYCRVNCSSRRRSRRCSTRFRVTAASSRATDWGSPKWIRSWGSFLRRAGPRGATSVSCRAVRARH